MSRRKNYPPEVLERAAVLMLAAEPSARTKVTDPTSAHTIAYGLLAGRQDEALICIALDRRRHVVAADVLTVGCDAFTIVDSRQILRWALTRQKPVSAIILAHNHPSGDVTPSSQDRDVTERVRRACNAVGLALLDHLVVADNGAYTSLSASGDLEASPLAGPGWTT